MALLLSFPNWLGDSVLATGLLASLSGLRQPPAVDVVMVAGRVVVRDGRYALADRDDVERAAYETVKRWAQGPAVRMLKDAVTDLYRDWPEGAAPSRGLRSRN